MQLGIIGFGEVGASFGYGLRKAGLTKVLAYDKMWNEPDWTEIMTKKAKEADVELVNHNRTLIERSDVLIIVTTADVALSTAEESLPWLDEGKVYADLNSASPKTKERIASMVETKGVAFVDGAIMGSPEEQKHEAPILISGSGTKQLVEFGSQWGMNLKVVGEKPGQAAAIKMIRSIWAKGIEALLIETFHAAEKRNLTDFILQSITDMMSSGSFPELADMLITSNTIHSLRRGKEMDAVRETLQEMNVNATMSEATRNKLFWSAGLGLGREFKEKPPSGFRDVVRIIAARYS